MKLSVDALDPSPNCRRFRAQRPKKIYGPAEINEFYVSSDNYNGRVTLQSDNDEVLFVWDLRKGYTVHYPRPIRIPFGHFIEIVFDPEPENSQAEWHINFFDLRRFLSDAQHLRTYIRWLCKD